MSLDVQIGEKLGHARRNAGLTVDEIAKMLKIAEQEIVAYEAGNARVPAERLFQAAQAYGVDLRWFFDQTENNEELSTEQTYGDNTNLDGNTSILADVRANENLAKLCDAARESDYILLNRSKVA